MEDDTNEFHKRLLKSRTETNTPVEKRFSMGGKGPSEVEIERLVASGKKKKTQTEMHFTDRNSQVQDNTSYD